MKFECLRQQICKNVPIPIIAVHFLLTIFTKFNVYLKTKPFTRFSYFLLNCYTNTVIFK